MSNVNVLTPDEGGGSGLYRFITTQGEVALGVVSLPLGSTGVNAVTGTAPIVSSGGTSPAISITPATEVAAGSMSAADKTKLDNLPASSVIAVTGTLPIVSSGGTSPAISINAATESTAGSMSPADKTKLDNLPANPVTAVTGTAPIGSTGGTTPAISISPATGVAAGSMSAADKAKLDGITTPVISSVSGSAPITSTGGTTPTVGITPATSSAAGSMSAADKAKLDAIGTIVTAVTGTAPIVSSGGTTPAISITAATPSAAGSLSAADKTKLDSLSAGYSPAVATNWTPAPTTPAGALDQIAAMVPNFFASGTIGPAGTVTFTSTNVAVQGSAQVLVIATFNAFGSVANTSAAVTLGIDGVPGTNLANANCACGAANGPMTATLIAVTTLSRPGPHTFTVQGIATGGVLTVSAGFINIVVVPFGG